MKIDKFRGIAPTVAKHLLNENFASSAWNCYLRDGRLQGVGQDVPVVTSAPAGAKTIYRYAHSTWVYWSSEVDVVRTPNVTLLGGNERIYFTGLDVPRVADAGTINSALDGVTGYKLGVPRPTAAPSVTVTTLEPNSAERAYNPLDQVDKYYVFTYVNQWGEESAFSPVSTAITCYDDSHVTLTFPTPPAANGYVPLQSIRIYRSNTGNAATVFELVDTIPIAQGSYLDTLPDDRLGAPAETEFWDVPPAGLKGLVALANGSLAGIDGRDVCLTPEYVPYAWPGNMRYTMPDEPVALVALGMSLVVLTKSKPYLLTGASPLTMTREEVGAHQPCLSSKAVTQYKDSALYASPDGLISVSPSGSAQNVTKDLFSRTDWTLLSPANMTFAVFDDYVFGFTPTDGFMFDPVGQNLTRLDFGYESVHEDLWDDTLYGYTGSQIVAIGASSATRAWEWTSKLFYAPDKGFACARVHTSNVGMSCTFTYIEQDVETFTHTAWDGDAFWLPASRSRRIQFKLSSTGVGVDSVALAQSMRGLDE
jgi:hypothetical protein